MFKYDEKENIMDIYKVRKLEKSTAYQPTEVWKSYEEYRKVGLKKDIEELLIPALNDIVKSFDSDIELVNIASYDCRYDNTSNYSGHAYNSAFVKFGGSLLMTTYSKPFCIFKLPYMDEYGMITREGKNYALISELVQDDDITYNDNVLKIVTEEGCYINIDKDMKTKFHNSKQDTVTMMLGLAKEEGIDPTKLYNKLTSLRFWNKYKTPADLAKAVEYDADQFRGSDFASILKSPRYSLRVVRDRINETVSLDRALGKVLSRDVVLKDGSIIPAETTITEGTIKTLKFNQINEVYVLYVPNMTGYYLGQGVSLYIIRQGTEITDELRALRPELKGRYLAEDIYVKEGLFFPPGIIVNKALLEIFAYNGVKDVLLKKSENSEEFTKVPLELNIISNRHFRKCELGIDKSNDYVYVSEDGKTIEPPKTHLCAYDLAALLSLNDNLQKGMDLNVVANLDAGLRKKVDLPYQSFHKAFVRAIPEFKKVIKNKFKADYMENPSMFGNPDYMEARFFRLSSIWWQQLYREMKLIKRIDMENPVSFYSSFDKINAIVKDKNAISDAQHSISMHHFGKICPYETPSGKTMGIVSNMATGCKIINNRLYTAYYELRRVGDDSYIQFKPVYLSARDEEKWRIADITSLVFDEKTGKVLTKGRVLARTPNPDGIEKVTVSYVDIKYIKYVNVDPQQFNGNAATTIPFQGADDSARVIFGLSMAKQAKGLVKGDIPRIITSGFRDIPRISPYYMIQAEYDGVVLEARGGTVVMQYDNIPEPKVYRFKMRQFDGKSVVIRSLNVQEGQVVKAGHILVGSNFVENGLMVTGKNVLVGFVNTGFNYEDGVTVSQRLTRDLTSYGAHKESENIPKACEHVLPEYVNKFSYAKAGGVVAKYKASVNGSKQRRLVRSRKMKGFVVDSSIVKDPYNSKKMKVETISVSMDMLSKGDKVANRHGNKGVTPLIQQNNLMPRFKNGEIIDVAYNPEGVPSRMNIGQVLEAHSGLAAHILDIRINSDSFNGATTEDIKLLLSYTWDLANTDNPELVFSSPEYAVLPEGLHNHCRQRLHKIQYWKGCFNKDGTAQLWNPIKQQYFDAPVTVGVNYVYKLIHESAKKEHGRAGLCTEPYVEKLASPTHGASNSGGQRMAYMEFDAYLAYGASALVHELQNERGDNPVARNNFTVDAVHTGDGYKVDESAGIRRSTEYFVNALECLGIVTDFEGVLPNNTRSECRRRQYYKPKALITAVDVGSKQGQDGMSLSNYSKRLSDL